MSALDRPFSRRAVLGAFAAALGLAAELLSGRVRAPVWKAIA